MGCRALQGPLRPIRAPIRKRKQGGNGCKSCYPAAGVTDVGRRSVPPMIVAVVMVLQRLEGLSDREAVELTLVDARWQMVLGVLGAEEQAFSQGALQKFRERLVAYDMDRRLLERTVELAKTTRGFETASEISLFGLSAQASNTVSSWSILIFPALFAAGMTLVDTTDGVLMLGAYGWAYRNPLRKLFYNLTITSVSVLVALVVGGIETLGLIAGQFHLALVTRHPIQH